MKTIPKTNKKYQVNKLLFMIALSLVLGCTKSLTKEEKEAKYYYNFNLCKELVNCLGAEYSFHEYSSRYGCRFYDKQKEFYQIFSKTLGQSKVFCKVFIKRELNGPWEGSL